MEVKMEVTNEEPEQSSGLTQGDLAIAAYALAETYNSYLEQYDEEDFGELSKEQMESSMDSLRTAFSKFDAILKAMQPQEEEQ
jgi:hypothetical protein